MKAIFLTTTAPQVYGLVLDQPIYAVRIPAHVEQEFTAGSGMCIFYQLVNGVRKLEDIRNESNTMGGGWNVLQSGVRILAFLCIRL